MRILFSLAVGIILTAPSAPAAFGGDFPLVPPLIRIVLKSLDTLGPFSGEIAAQSVDLDPAFSKVLQDSGFSFEEDGSIVQSTTGAKIPWVVIRKAGFDLDSQGRLVYAQSGIEVELRHLPKMLEGLLELSKLRMLSPIDVGKKLQTWGIPSVFDGIHLLNPDGSATFFGLLLYQGLWKNQHALNQLSGERLSKSLELFQGAYTQAFGESAPDLAYADLTRAWDLLSWQSRKPGETSLVLAPYPKEMSVALSDYKTGLKGAITAAKSQNLDPSHQARLEQSLSSLEKLEKLRYHTGLEPGLVLRPTSIAGPPPHHNLLPQLVQTLDKINGKPLSGRELEALIKSVPMGESIWRMGVHELWRAGLTGEGVQVAVIDTGAGHHPELQGVVGSRQNFTHQRGGGTLGNHATAVAGLIHALAPGTTVYSYRALDERSFQENARLHLTQEETQTALLKAVDKAVADGNRIVNMSLGGAGCPCGELAQRIDKYAKQGVIFVISAGNEKDSGVRNPSNASSAITIGALDVNNRLAAFSSYGENFDPSKLSHVIKTVFMTPGQRMPVLMHNLQGSYMYGKMSGTSVAAPHMSGTMALLLPAVQQLNRSADPFQLSRKLQEALVRTAKAIPRNELPSNVPPEQDFLIVDPVAAYRALRPSA